MIKKLTLKKLKLTILKKELKKSRQFSLEENFEKVIRERIFE